MKILVTGGSRGIGKSIVEKYKREGHHVYYPTREELDLSKKPTLPWADFDVIINNAGINIIKSLPHVSGNEVMQVNYLSPLDIIQQCLPHMVKNKWGRIINIGSIWIESTKPNRLEYNASKHALHALTKSVTAEYANHNILCNTVSPGYIETDMTFENNSMEIINEIRKNTPIRRLGKPDEVADLVYYLTQNNNFITGQNINIDGGFLCTTY